jgi:hypothetical protein
MNYFMMMAERQKSDRIGGRTLLANLDRSPGRGGAARLQQSGVMVLAAQTSADVLVAVPEQVRAAVPWADVAIL